jgi:hypothetical protein
LYREIVLERVRAAIGAARAVRGLSHQGLKGQIREVLVRELFQPILPPTIGIGRGCIISSFDEEKSGEQDVILFDRRILPPILYDASLGIFPIESVLFVIEVKSTLTAAELKKSHSSASQLYSLKMASGELLSPNRMIQAPYILFSLLTQT